MKDKECGGEEDKIRKSESSKKEWTLKWSNKKFKNTMFLTGSTLVRFLMTNRGQSPVWETGTKECEEVIDYHK